VPPHLWESLHARADFGRLFVVHSVASRGADFFWRETKLHVQLRGLPLWFDRHSLRVVLFLPIVAPGSFVRSTCMVTLGAASSPTVEYSTVSPGVHNCHRRRHLVLVSLPMMPQTRAPQHSMDAQRLKRLPSQQRLIEVASPNCCQLESPPVLMMSLDTLSPCPWFRGGFPSVHRCQPVANCDLATRDSKAHPGAIGFLSCHSFSTRRTNSTFSQKGCCKRLPGLGCP
jgi:hypothetical protein